MDERRHKSRCLARTVKPKTRRNDRIEPVKNSQKAGTAMPVEPKMVNPEVPDDIDSIPN
jgi:hypothetical protein